MKRRDFLYSSSLLTAGAFVSPSLFATSCAKDPYLPDSDYQGKVLIIGAGAAGLYAGYTLNRAGINFEVLEASNRIGGRMGKTEEFADHTIDLGAQWLHGCRSIAGDLVKMHNHDFKRDKSDMFFYFNGSLTEDLPQDVSSIFGSTGSQDISFHDYAHSQGYGAEYDNIVQANAGSYGADAKLLSTKYAAIEEEEWNSGSKDYKFARSYWDVIKEGVADSIMDKIKTNVVITNIDYSGSKVIVTDQLGGTYEADKVIVTVPIPILQDGDISFNPALPQEKIDAFNKIGMGPGMKVFLKFSNKFYKDNTVGGTVCAAYADDKEGKNGNDNILLAFLMGDQAKALSDLGNDDDIAQALLAELDQIYDGQATASYMDKLVIDYTTMPFIRGAYSYATIGIGNARSIAAEDIDDKLYFAGEAMNLNGHHQTVHGALETGYNKVLKILENA